VEPRRPDPNELLKQVQEEEARQARAKLKIFFGMAPGVGKTYAMLQDAQDRLDEGVDVVIGVVETHDRSETAALLAGLNTLPKRTLPYRGISLEEFDLQGAILRKPQLMLMDELAHTNVQGSIHGKRWQDVWDLLDAGINVYTTVNVQHIESLKDIVAQITGVIVRESIPDTILARADEIELVDLPPEELIQRLKEGKVYIPEQARHAIDRFFRKGNLLALRELALRRTADHVDADMRRYMSDQGITKTWAVDDRLLVCISPAPESARLIRATQRLAERIKAPWIAAYVETGRIRHSGKERDQIEEHLRLVERLGGETAVLQGNLTLAEDLIALAVSRNVTRILVGKPGGPPWLRFLRPSLVDLLVRIGGQIDVMVIARDQDLELPPPRTSMSRPRITPPLLHFLGSALVIGSATGLGLLMQMRRFELADIVMVYVLGILIVATRFGLWPAVTASILSVGAFDFFFVPPTLSFTISDAKHAGTFAVMLTVGIVIGNLAERIRAQVRLARVREQRTLALFRLAAELTRSGGTAAMVESAIRSVAAQFQSFVSILLPDSESRLKSKEQKDPTGAFSPDELGVAQWSFDHHEVAGLGTETLPGSKALYIPLKGSRGPIGVMVVKPDDAPHWAEPDQRHLLEAFANQTALALERALLSEQGAETQRKMDREHLHNALLSSVSHDLRTPLGSIIGAASTLLENDAGLNLDGRKGLLESIHEEAHQLQRLVTNLLDVTRMESGVVEVKKEWVPVEELVGMALERLSRVLGGREIKVELPAKLPLAPVDPVLMEQVLVNLLENAAKFSPVDRPIEIQAWATERTVTLAIADHGSGLPEGLDEKIFDKLVKAANPFGRPGAGLGLTICKGIVEAHGGWIQGSNRPQGGAQFLVSLPLGVAKPPLPEEAGDA
jgi:two-component system sensor histidine kinase KdpD